MTAIFQGPLRQARLILGNALERLRELPDCSVQCIVTSPPYYGLRDYKIPPQVWGGDPACAHKWSIESVPVQQGTGGNWTQAENGDGLRTGIPQTRFRGDTRASRGTAQMATAERGSCSRCGAWLGSLGLEPTVALYVAHMVEIFEEARRVLREDGTLWLNLGDAYWSRPNGSIGATSLQGSLAPHAESRRAHALRKPRREEQGLKHKDLVGMPWRVALALQDAGWYLRSEIIWSKTAPMPESVRDRPTRSHEHIFLLSKGPRYYADFDAVREPVSAAVEARPYKQVFNSAREDVGQPGASPPRRGCVTKKSALQGAHGSAGHDGNGMRMAEKWNNPAGRNIRTVWEIGPEPCKEAHFATFPSEIPRRAILVGTSAAGCCPACGAPWARVTKRGFRPQGDVSAERARRGSGATKPMDASNGWQGVPRGSVTTTTTGWAPTCRCNAGGEPIPCTVLDPFLGSGRTGTTALELGRSFVGIELSRVYLETIAQPAITQALAQDVIGETRDRVPLEVDDGQRPLFDFACPVGAGAPGGAR